MNKDRIEAFLYTQSGVNEKLTATAREELQNSGVSFQEIDLTKLKLDREWPMLPVISCRAGFFGNLQNEEDVKSTVSLIR